jgi:hypothetical protein|tara:strand:+ start:2418 stop:3962 length:1545 start_codon:yes stop_codon:yes gene_type:complete
MDTQAPDINTFSGHLKKARDRKKSGFAGTSTRSSPYSKSFETLFRSVSKDIFQFCRAINFQPSEQQSKLLRLVEDATYGNGLRKIAVKSGQGPGKTAVTTVAALWRSLRVHNALTVVTAPTMRQCKEVWLSEVRRTLQAAPAIFRQFIEVTKSKVVICNKPKWGVDLVTATRPENAQGIHEDNLTIICEEASGIPSEIVETFEGTITNPNSLLLMIGNPNTTKCPFYDCFTRFRHLWATLTFNAEDSPFVSKDNIEYLAEKYGRNSDVFRVRVLGEFPHSDPTSIISVNDLEKCVDLVNSLPTLLSVLRKGYTDHEKPFAKVQQYGIDFARYGSDESVIYQREGNVITDFEFYAHTDPNDVVDRSFYLQHNQGWKDEDTWFVGDAGGMGQGVMGNFHRAGKNIHEFNNNGTAANKKEYENRITEAWFEFGELVKDQKCSIPNDNILIHQLSQREYDVAKDGKLRAEPKEAYMKRGNPSPDRADAMVMAFYDDMIAPIKMTGRPARKRVGIQRSA